MVTELSAMTVTLTYVLAFSTRRHGHPFHHGIGTALGAAGLVAVGVVVLVVIVLLVVWLYRRAKRRLRRLTSSRSQPTSETVR